MEDFEQEFRDAFERHSDELFRHAALRLPDRERALEITQETFMKVWDYARKGGEIRELRPFLYRTLKNLIIDEYRKAKIQSLEAMAAAGDIDEVEFLMPADESNTLEAAMERFDGKRALVVLQKLADPYREVLVLRYVDGLSPKEIAPLLDESENAVSVRIHRALKKLRDMLEEEHMK